MTTSTDKNPVFSFPSTGTYTVSMTATLPSGKFGTISKDIDVFLLSDVSYTYSDDGCGTVTFTDTSAAPNIISWHWEFDDGFTSDVQNPVHTFPFPFNYGVSLTVRTLNGGIGFTQQNIVIVGGTVTAGFTEVVAGTSVAFTDTTTADCDIAFWRWEFGDGSTSTDQNPTYDYGDVGTFTVSLTVTDVLGNQDTASHDVTTANYDWSFTFDFTADDGLSNPFPPVVTGTTAGGFGTGGLSYVGGTGWVETITTSGGTFTDVFIQLQWPRLTDFDVVEAIVTYDRVYSTIISKLSRITTATNTAGSTSVQVFDDPNTSGGTGLVWDATITDRNIKYLNLKIQTHQTAPETCTLRVTNIEFHGNGTNPFI